VAASVRSLIATNSIFLSLLAALNTILPILPKPLIATRNAIEIPPRMDVGAQPFDWEKLTNNRAS
jgi:hypothetical protein